MSERSLALMGDEGHLTFVWEESDDEKIIPAIEQKMKEGVSFFIVEPRFFGLLPAKHTELSKASDAKKQRALAVKDAGMAAFLSAAASADVVPEPNRGKEMKAVKRAETAEEVAKGHSVGVKPKKGG